MTLEQKIRQQLPEEAFQQFLQDMEQAEQEGFFEEMFTGQCRECQQFKTKEDLLWEIWPGMKLYRSFFLEIYGYEISYPGFAQTAIQELENAGCSKAREYYQSTVNAYEEKRERELKEVSKWYNKQADAEFTAWVKRKKEEGEEQRKQEETDLLRRKQQLLKQKLQP